MHLPGFHKMQENDHGPAAHISAKPGSTGKRALKERSKVQGHQREECGRQLLGEAQGHTHQFSQGPLEKGLVCEEGLPAG